MRSEDPSDHVARHFDTTAIGIDRQLTPVPLASIRFLLTKSLVGAQARLAASHDLRKRHDGVTHAIVMVHGMLRNVEPSFSSPGYLSAARQLTQAHPNAMAVALQFPADVDDVVGAGMQKEDLRWTVEGWKGAEPAIDPSPISSFTVVDELLVTLVARLPALRSVTLMGNSAGGQFVSRYAALGKGLDLDSEATRRGVHLRYVASNASAYMYLDERRPVPRYVIQEMAAMAGEDDRSAYTWRNQLTPNAPPYAAAVDMEVARDRLLHRDLHIVVGADDNKQSAGLQQGVSDLAQGRNRLSRARNYDWYLHHLMLDLGFTKRRSKLHVLDGVGHDVSEVCAHPVVQSLASPPGLSIRREPSGLH